MSIVMSSLTYALGIPPTKLPPSVAAFVSYVVPAVASYFIFAVLAITPSQSRTARLALWPVVAFLALRAVVSTDWSAGKPELKFLQVNLVQLMIVAVFHTLSWSFSKKPLVRHLRAANSSPSIIMDALDLTTNFRGHGWDWSRGLYIPRDTRPTNRISFVFYVLLSTVLNGLASGGLHRAIHVLTAGKGSTIYDESLPFFARHLRASVISIFSALTIYNSQLLFYNVLTILGVLFGQDPALWPPGFDSPWCATSLTDFWGRRWHQWARHTFITAAYPFSVVFGRAGRVVGVFLASAAYHHLIMLTFNPQSEFRTMFVSFGMMAVGVVAERAFYKTTGRKVCGVVGWIWAMTWLFLWGNVMSDGYLRSGMYAQQSAIDSDVSAWALTERLAMGFDAWLRTI